MDHPGIPGGLSRLAPGGAISPPYRLVPRLNCDLLAMTAYSLLQTSPDGLMVTTFAFSWYVVVASTFHMVGLNNGTALSVLATGAGSQWDPECVLALLQE